MRPLFFMLLAMLVVSRCEEAPAYHDINDMFPSFNEADKYADLPDDSYVNITIDVEKLDLNKFKKKMTGELVNKLTEKDVTSPKNISRRTPLIMLDWEGVTWYHHQSQIVQNQVAVDLILQLVYMAKSTIKVLENDKNFNSKDTAYRMGYIYNKMKKAYRYMVDIIMMLYRQHKDGMLYRHLHLHHRLIKQYVDFQYWYWVLVKLDGMYRDRSGPSHKPQLPKKNKKTGGLSIESDFDEFAGQKTDFRNYGEG